MTLRTHLPLVALSITVAAAAPALLAESRPDPSFLVVETNRGFSRLQDAVDAIGGKSGTIRIASGRHADCAVQQAGTITYVAAVPGQAVFDGVACEGKGTLVLRGHAARVEGLVFANVRVPDFNGAGIRLERGDLAISQSWFRDSQQGVLAGADTRAAISIDKSTFTRLGTCEGAGGCAHSIYIGDYGALSVTRSRFEAGRGGHYVKSRSRQITVLGNSFDDTAGRRTNYMIDLPGGAGGRIAGNWFVQGSSKENWSAFIAIAAEGRQYSSAGLVIEANDARFAPGAPAPSVFVADWSGEVSRIGTNALAPGLARYEQR
ncbi:MAG: right-handed parallel beta-helix repeat-containing protein [Sphingomonadales bacterium]|nr:right-handed parallel beta-helix repeat-containing protein [Sphingomonadales bacterium]